MRDETPALLLDPPSTGRPPTFAFDLAAVFDQLHESVAVYDRSGHVLHINETGARLHGRGAIELVGRRIWDVLAEPNGFRKAFERAASTGVAQHFDHYHGPWDRHFEVHIHAVGEVVFVLQRDVTEAALARRRLDALSELTALAHATRSHSFDDIAAVTARGLDGDTCSIHLFAADGLVHVHGLHDRMPEAEDVLRSLPPLGSDEGVSPVVRRAGRALLFADTATADQLFTYRGVAARSALNRFFPATMMVAPLFADDVIVGTLTIGKRGRPGLRAYSEADLAVFETFADRVALIIARTHAAAERARLERQLTTVTSVLPALVAFVDTEQRYRFASGRYQEWFGRPPADLVGRHVADLLGPEAYEVLRPHIERALAGETVSFDATVPYRAGVRDVRVHYVPVRGDDGAVEGYGALVLDVSHDVAEALRREALHHEVALARAAAERAGRAKDEFLALLGHELRNPLAPIRTALELMQLRTPDLLVKERAVIERQVCHLTRMVDDLLDVARIAQGKIEIKASPLRLQDVIATAIEMASPMIERRGHTLTTHLPETPLVVNGDEHRLAQVFANLLCNAARYTPPGGHLDLTATAGDHTALVRVRDDGVGMPAELVPRVFDLFVQGPRDSARSDGGLGLGLAIVRSLVELHGGAVSADSDGPGHGSTFAVTLPLSTAVVPESPRAHTHVHDTAVNGRPRVLVVDDNQDAADTLCEALVDAGFDVRVAHDGPAALATAASWLPTIALLDLGLPVMDGYEVGARIRELPGIGPGLRLVAVTGYGQESDRRRVTAAGFAAHLVKPVSLDVLIEVVLALEGSRAMT